MTDDIAISINGASKAYRMWATPAARLTAPTMTALARLLPGESFLEKRIRHRASTRYTDFWALRDVSFQVRKGESLGIIGRNGSGKSTLLQIISGTLQPTSGTSWVQGRIAALLELGSGFNPEFTGRENVYLNASLLGLSRQEIDARYPDMVAFAEIGEFIDHPVKTYSSGMVLRLAFAVAAHVDPEVLIIDEALAVGDARFQLKCARAIDRFVASGVTLLFVSHDLSSVKRLCKQAILLEHGQLLYQGTPTDVTNLYSKLIADGGSAAAIASDIQTLRSRATAASGSPAGPAFSVPPSPSAESNTAAPANVSEPADPRSAHKSTSEDQAPLPVPEHSSIGRKADALLRDERHHIQVSGQEFAYGGELGRITDLAVVNQRGESRTWFTTGETVVVLYTVETVEDLPEPVFALTIRNSAGLEIYGTNTLFSGQPARPMKAGERRTVSFTFSFSVMPGTYFLSFGFTHFFGDKLLVLHRRYDAVKLDVHSRDRTFGIANLHAKIEEVRSSSGAANDDTIPSSAVPNLAGSG